MYSKTEMNYINTIDLDNIDKEKLEQIKKKIESKTCLIKLQVKDSSSKGYHLLLICNQKCDLCRIVFDDQKRLEMDSNRQEKLRNTLFTSKEYVRGNLKNLRNTCEKCSNYGNIIQLVKKDLTFEQTIEKIKIGKISMPLGYRSFWFRVVYLGFNYLECPTCGWFKFVKMTDDIEHPRETKEIRRR